MKLIVFLFQYRLEIQHLDEETENSILVDQWEIKQDEIKFDQIIGNGAFGVVWKGSIKTKDDSTVAIKMLKGKCRHIVQYLNPLPSRNNYRLIDDSIV